MIGTDKEDMAAVVNEVTGMQHCVTISEYSGFNRHVLMNACMLLSLT